ncbi:glycosyltransferase family 1 protein [Fulvivirga sp. RKSG066]|uniref:glycosyltransferase family 4 protein n=1 Tax=Fulvivirga aurantia TaxID=2529383 RepID=UPI0012BB6786|nr:glycosyltransferase family 4 protein [Fulvivirga aurantia]MTI19979.1 glycosyltransferase family 1 protein [Fulvivirga aurantia]
MTENNSAIFIVPRSSSAWVGSEAIWITVAGWARASKKKFDNTIVITTDRVAKPNEVLDYPLGSNYIKKKIYRRRFKLLPKLFKVLFKDILQYKSSKSSSNYQSFYTSFDDKPAFVWEQHDIFPGPGRKIANKFKVPLITYVHAPQVWEAAKWGVHRPVWGDWIEKNIETRSLLQSDLIACVSFEVENKLIQMGVPKEKILVSPMAVDIDLFGAINRDEVLLSKLGLKGKKVLGWTGSFRKFHGLDILIEAFKNVLDKDSNIALLLVGDGGERGNVEQIVKELGIEQSVVFTGRKKFTEIPRYVGLFDVAIVSARSNEGFHYSPLKLREYMCAGVASMAPRAGEIPQVFDDGENILLYEAGNINSISATIKKLFHNRELRNNIAINGKRHIKKTGTWEVELSKTLSKLKIL